MKGILYVSHGSRIPEACQEAVDFLSLVKTQVEVELQEICFLELAEPNVEQGMERLIKLGATEIAIVPVLLLSAGHYFQDIPEEIQQLKDKYPNIHFSYGRPLGVQERLIHILKERIEEKNIPVDQAAKVLVVGRGSSNPQTKVDVEWIGKKLQEVTGFKHVNVCYLAACTPLFEESLKQALDQGHSKVFVVPYLWFTGYLMRFIERKINDLDREDKVVLCHHLGDHPVMQQALKDRVYESFKPAYQF
ncbi:sirohydrochlorin chelatase [Oceanobacillus senegalensis]|uniref:sirohydrochlorin chelatase n=1 Tax=Oceanobacillus senegalensis TaxID=1936063 RepID=UPI000A307282|nr:sirohydrochlorin chelatase [Oceanobacillus senegalensis]